MKCYLPVDGATGRPEDYQPDGRFVYQGFRYYSTGELRTTALPPMQRLFRYANTGARTLCRLRSLELSDLAAVIVYHGTSGFVARLRSLCKHLARASDR